MSRKLTEVGEVKMEGEVKSPRSPLSPTSNQTRDAGHDIQKTLESMDHSFENKFQRSIGKDVQDVIKRID